MDRLLVVVFDAESKAYEAKKALHELDRETSSQFSIRPWSRGIKMVPHR